MRDGAQVHVLQLAARRHAARQARDAQATGTQGAGQRVCRDFAFGTEAGGQDDLLDHAVARTLEQALGTNLGRADAIERADAAHQHEVQAAVAAAALQRRLVGGCFHHAQQTAVASRVQTGGAELGLGESAAALAGAHALHGVGQRTGQLARAVAVVLQQMEGHALRRLDAHAGQAAQGVDQVLQRLLAHLLRTRTGTSCRAAAACRR